MSLADKIRATQATPPPPRGVPGAETVELVDEPSVGERPTKPNLPVMLTPSQRKALDDATTRERPAASIVRALLELWRADELGDDLSRRVLDMAQAETARLRVRKPRAIEQS